MKMKWNKPELITLGVENTLCDDYVPSHGGDDPNGDPGNSGKLKCTFPGCNHACPNQTTLDKHMATHITGEVPAQS